MLSNQILESISFEENNLTKVIRTILKTKLIILISQVTPFFKNRFWKIYFLIFKCEVALLTKGFALVCKKSLKSAFRPW